MRRSHDKRDRDAAADAIAADHRDRRLADAGASASVASSAAWLYVADGLRRRAQLVELRDVGARDERLVAGALEDDHADRRRRAASSSTNVCRRCHIASETALWRAGLLNVIQPIGPSVQPAWRRSAWLLLWSRARLVDSAFHSLTAP